MDMQAAMKTHLSQSTGVGAFDGQPGISFAISSIITDGGISSAIACIEAPEDASAMTGRKTGASARLAIPRIASSRRMARLRFIPAKSHKLANVGSPLYLVTSISTRQGAGKKNSNACFSTYYLSDASVLIYLKSETGERDTAQKSFRLCLLAAYLAMSAQQNA